MVSVSGNHDNPRLELAKLLGFWGILVQASFCEAVGTKREGR